MKSKNILLGILAIALVFTMTAVGCENGETETVPVIETFPTDVPSATGTITKAGTYYGGGYFVAFKNDSPTKVYLKVGNEVKSIGANQSVSFDVTTSASISYSYAPSNLVQKVDSSNYYYLSSEVKFVGSNVTTGTITISHSQITIGGVVQSAAISKVVITNRTTGVVALTDTTSIPVLSTSRTFTVPSGNYNVEITKGGSTYNIGTGMTTQSIGASLGYLPLPAGGVAKLTTDISSGRIALGWSIQ